MGEHNAFLLSLNVRDALNQFSKTHEIGSIFSSSATKYLFHSEKSVL